MKDLKLDDTGDISLTNNDLDEVSDDEELEQSIKIILQTRLSEFEPADELGLDPGNMYGKGINKEYLSTDISDAITEQEPRVASITSIQIGEPDEDRNLDIKIEYVKQDGTKNEMETGVSVDD